MCWLEDSLHITKLSNISDPEIIQHPGLHKYVNEDLSMSFTSRFKSIKSEIWLKEGGEYEQTVSTVAGMSSKAAVY